MTTFTLSCEVNHEPMSWDTQADTKEAAVANFMQMEEVKSHIMEAHPEMASKSEDEMKTAVMEMVSEKPAQA